MNNLRQKLLAGVSLCLMALPAHAATVTFDFTGTPNGFGALSSFLSFTEDGLTLELTASAEYQSTLYNGMDIGQYGQYGLGIYNPGDYFDYSSQAHAIDGKGASDRMNLSFSEDVKLVSAEFFYYGDNTSFNLFFDGSEIAYDIVQNGTYSSGNLGDFSFATLSLIGDLFNIGAGDTKTETVTRCRRRHHGRKYCYEKEIASYSAFKLRGLTVETTGDGGEEIPEVPLPASLPLFGTGLALLGYLGMRRRKKANA